MLAVLEAAREQHLQAEADPQERPAGADVFADHGVQAGFPQAADGVLKRPDPRQHQPPGVRDRVRIVGDDRDVAELLERLLHAPQIGHAVINDGDRFHATPATPG